MNKIIIIDYGMGNLDSIARAVEISGAVSLVTDKLDDIKQAKKIILPGVGAFPDGINNLKNNKIDELLKEKVKDEKIYLLGICLGMQLLADKSYEIKESAGLGIIPGQVVKLCSQDKKERIPHMGWNEVYISKKNKLFEGIYSGKDFYFVHSFHFECEDEYILTKTPYCNEFVSGVHKNNVFGVQFHPEKSQKYGLQLIQNFISLS